MAPTKKRINLRIDASDRELFARAAEDSRETMTQFLVESGRERAERLLADRTNFVVDDVGWEEIMDAMDRPAQVKPRLAELLSRPRPE